MTRIRINETAGEIKKFYPYRQAILTNWAIKIVLDDQDIAYIGRLLKRAGYKIDNHIVFCTDTMNYWLHDGALLVGGKVLEESY